MKSMSAGDMTRLFGQLVTGAAQSIEGARQLHIAETQVIGPGNRIPDLRCRPRTQLEAELRGIFRQIFGLHARTVDFVIGQPQQSENGNQPRPVVKQALHRAQQIPAGRPHNLTTCLHDILVRTVHCSRSLMTSRDGSTAGLWLFGLRQRRGGDTLPFLTGGWRTPPFQQPVTPLMRDQPGKYQRRADPDPRGDVLAVQALTQP